MSDERSQNVTIKNETKGRGLFYGVIAIAVFVIMAVGTTFAYFTATTNSADASVQTGSTNLQLEYIGYNGAWMNNDLIPADTNVVEYSFEYQNDTTAEYTDTLDKNGKEIVNNALCKDDYGNSICSVFVFQVKNDALSKQVVSLSVKTENNEFGNLTAMAYRISEPTDEGELAKYNGKENNNGEGDPIFLDPTSDPGTDEGLGEDIPYFKGPFYVYDKNANPLSPDKYQAVYVNRLGVVKTLLNYVDGKTTLPAINRPISLVPAENARIADEIEIDGGGTVTLALVLYIKNIDSDQTGADAEKKFQGSVIIGPGDGSDTGVSGSISIGEDQELSSGEILEAPKDGEEEEGEGEE